MTSIALSVVVPLHNEEAVIEELVRRLRAALSRVTGSSELVLVDDASTDGTAAALASLAGVRIVTMTENVGQFRATCAGLAEAHGQAVIVMDGDLQDPPELIPELAHALGEGELAFGVKTRRQDPLWFRLGRVGYRALSLLGSGVPPSGAGSYCVMSRTLAQRVATSPWRTANLSVVAVRLAQQEAPWATVDYAKAARYDGQSRVGPWGLIQEAMGSLRVSGALWRLGLLVGALALSVITLR